MVTLSVCESHHMVPVCWFVRTSDTFTICPPCSEQCVKSLDDFMEWVLNDPDRQLPRDGTVHQRTSNVIMFCDQLVSHAARTVLPAYTAAAALFMSFSFFSLFSSFFCRVSRFLSIWDSYF